MELLVERKNARLYADLHEGPSGQPGDPALLLHGLGGAAPSWQGLAEGLALGRTVLVPELRGCGRSERGSGRLGLESMADDVVAFLDQLGYERCHLTGHSLGGVIAQDLLVRHGDRVRSAVLVSTSGRVGEKAAANWRGLADRIEREGLDAMAAATARGFSEDFINANPEAIAHHRRLTEESDPQVWAEQARAAASYDYETRLATVKQPVLVLQGSADRLTPTGGAVLLSRALGSSTFEIIDGVGHQLPTEMGRGFVERIEAFFSAAEIVE